MLISCNILKKHIKNSEDIDFLKIWDKFTIRTAEVEGVTQKTGNFDKVVTAKIIECEKHPDSKKLHILKVDTGDEITQIVCGAPNVRVGLIGACVKVSGHIDGVEISARPLAGVVSNGMMCSGKELGISDDHSGIIEFPEDTPIGKDIKELFPIEDIIVEIDNKSLTHRPDLWGHYGIAREIAAIAKHELLPLDLDEDSNKDNPLKIKIDNKESCYRYIGTKLDNITNNKTPIWMQIFLYYAGMRSISLIVDLTNYIMLELGQPMHAFDSRIVKDIEVGFAKDNDTFTTLDNNTRKLSKEDLMIKNGGEYFAIAGVMGGLNSEIIEDTNSIVLESACFEPSTIRKTAIRLGLRTEASARYEKSLDPNLAMIATKRFIKLLRNENPSLDYGSKITDEYPTIQKENVIELSKDLLKKYMGFELEDEKVLEILIPLGFTVKVEKDKYIVTAPTYRSTKDITIPADIIEEISRIYGYENFEHTPLKMNVSFGNKETTYDLEYDVKYFLSTKYNLNEVYTYLWNKTSFLKLLNIEIDNVKLLGRKEDNILRNDLNISMLECALTNTNNYEKFGIYEIGTIIENNDPKRRLSILLEDNIDNLKNAYSLIKEIVYSLFNEIKNINIDFKENKCDSLYNDKLSLGIYINDKKYGEINTYNKKVSNQINKKKCFVCAQIDFDEFENLEININEYKEVSKYPTVNLDYTIITSSDFNYSKLENILNGYTSPLIISRKLKDVYSNNENKKYTITYVVGSNEKTLTSEELNAFKTEFITYIRKEKLDIYE